MFNLFVRFIIDWIVSVLFYRSTLKYLAVYIRV